MPSFQKRLLDKITETAIEFIGDPENLQDKRISDIKSLEETLKQLSYTAEELVNPENLEEGKIFTREMFKITLAEQIFSWKLTTEESNYLLSLLAEDNYEGLLDTIKIKLEKHQEYIVSIQGIIIGAGNLLSEIKNGLFNTLAQFFGTKAAEPAPIAWAQSPQPSVEPSSSPTPSMAPPPPPMPQFGGSPPPPPPLPQTQQKFSPPQGAVGFAEVIAQLQKGGHKLKKPSPKSETIAPTKQSTTNDNTPQQPQLRSAATRQLLDKAPKANPNKIFAVHLKSAQGKVDKITHERQQIDLTVEELRSGIRKKGQELNAITDHLDDKQARDTKEKIEGELRKLTKELKHAEDTLKSKIEMLDKAKEALEKLQREKPLEEQHDTRSSVSPK